MWDLDSIIHQHNKYGLDEMMGSLRQEMAQAPSPRAWALTVLANKLVTGPPLLTDLISSMAESGVLARFSAMIMTLLPGHEAEILQERGNARVYRFWQLFQRKYFPLPQFNTQCSIEALMSSMPLDLLGLSYTAYHDLNFRPGYLLLLALVGYPFAHDERELEDDPVTCDPEERPEGWRPKQSDIKWLKDLMETLRDGGHWVAPQGFTITKINSEAIEVTEVLNDVDAIEVCRRSVLIAKKLGLKVTYTPGRTAKEKHQFGARLVLLESARKVVGDDVIKLIRPSGYTSSELHCIFDGTPHDAVALFADWAFGETGCILLDNNYENVSYKIDTSDNVFLWSKYNVSVLAKQWPRVKEIRTKIDSLVEWIEADPRARIAELIDFIRCHTPSSQAVSRQFKIQRKKARLSKQDNHILLQEGNSEDYDEEEDGEGIFELPAGVF